MSEREQGAMSEVAQLSRWIQFCHEPRSLTQPWDNDIDISRWWWLATDRHYLDRFMQFVGACGLGVRLRSATLGQWQTLSTDPTVQSLKWALERVRTASSASAPLDLSLDTPALSERLKTYAYQDLINHLQQQYPIVAERFCFHCMGTGGTHTAEYSPGLSQLPPWYAGFEGKAWFDAFSLFCQSNPWTSHMQDEQTQGAA